jgi:C-terminal processing protease CtpA/Prc
MNRPAWKWIVLGVVAGIVTLIWSGLNVRRAQQASAFARLPVREQNLAVFDTACALLERNYFAPELFQRPEWPAFKREWREQAAQSQGGGFLYFNVLQNFATRLPSSHVFFVQPPHSGPVTTATRSEPTESSRRFAALFLGGPGFDQAQIHRGEGRFNVVGEVMRGSPADRAGISPGWALKDFNIAGDGENVHFHGTFWTLDPPAAERYDRSGQPPEAPTVTVTYDYEPLETREDFELRELPRGATYLRFDAFDGWNKVNRVLDAIEQASPQGLVLDLRHNGGGRTFYLGRVLGRLLGATTVGETVGRGKRTPLDGLLLSGEPYEGFVVVLVGPSTASSAEIVAAAIQDLKRGLVIGRGTQGSVLSAQFFDLPDGGKLAVPVADYERKHGHRIEGVGVQPDIWVMPTLEDVRAGRDPVLERAIGELHRAEAARLSASARSAQAR